MGIADRNDDEQAFLRVEGLGKRYGSTDVLADVSFAVSRGEVLGIIGANGAGKSTLIKCLSGAETSSTGEIVVDGERLRLHGAQEVLRLGIAAVHQKVTLAEDQSVAENVLLGRLPGKLGFVSWRRLTGEVETLLSRVGLAVGCDVPVKNLSPSDKRLVMIAAALAREPRLIILDEPTAALPREESETVLSIVKDLSARGVCVLYVTHRLHEVCALADRVLALRNGRVSGSLDRHSATEEDMIALIGGDAEPQEVIRSGQHVHTEVRLPGEVLLEARSLSGVRVRDVDLTVRSGEIVGVAGLAGSGRSELLRLLYGLQPVTAGRCTMRGVPLDGSVATRARNRIGYVAELREANVLAGMSVTRNVTVNSVTDHRWAGVFVDGRWEDAVTSRMAEDVALVGRRDAPIETLSGGNQQKVLIGRWLVRDAEVLLLDEPTAGVDLVARAEIHRLLRERTAAGMGVVLASVEADELTAVCDRVVVMVEGRITQELTPPFTEKDLVAAFFRPVRVGA